MRLMDEEYRNTRNTEVAVEIVSSQCQVASAKRILLGSLECLKDSSPSSYTQLARLVEELCFRNITTTRRRFIKIIQSLTISSPKTGKFRNARVQLNELVRHIHSVKILEADGSSRIPINSIRVAVLPFLLGSILDDILLVHIVDLNDLNDLNHLNQQIIDQFYLFCDFLDTALNENSCQPIHLKEGLTDSFDELADMLIADCSFIIGLQNLISDLQNAPGNSTIGFNARNFEATVQANILATLSPPPSKVTHTRTLQLIDDGDGADEDVEGEVVEDASAVSASELPLSNLDKPAILKDPDTMRAPTETSDLASKDVKIAPTSAATTTDGPKDDNLKVSNNTPRDKGAGKIVNYFSAEDDGGKVVNHFVTSEENEGVEDRDEEGRDVEGDALINDMPLFKAMRLIEEIRQLEKYNNMRSKEYFPSKLISAYVHLRLNADLTPLEISAWDAFMGPILEQCVVKTINGHVTLTCPTDTSCVAGAIESFIERFATGLTQNREEVRNELRTQDNILGVYGGLITRSQDDIKNLHYCLTMALYNIVKQAQRSDNYDRLKLELLKSLTTFITAVFQANSKVFGYRTDPVYSKKNWKEELSQNMLDITRFPGACQATIHAMLTTVLEEIANKSDPLITTPETVGPESLELLLDYVSRIQEMTGNRLQSLLGDNFAP